MKTKDFFAGEKSFSKVAKELGHETETYEINPKQNPDIVCDLLDKDTQDKIIEDVLNGKVDFAWMSPPCTTFSMAAGNTHWTADRQPKTENAKIGLKLLQFCLRVAEACEKVGAYYCIENPRARARWFLPMDKVSTAWYCQYGDTRAKPTDICHNIPNWTPKTCHNFRKGEPKHCHHEAAPRGSKTGTQGLKNAALRSVIPPALFHEIFEALDNE